MRELGPGEVSATMWWNPLTVERIRMRTRLPADDCAARIQAHISFWYAGYLLLFFLVRGQRVFLVDTLQRILDAWKPVLWEPVVP